MIPLAFNQVSGSKESHIHLDLPSALAACAQDAPHTQLPMVSSCILLLVLGVAPEELSSAFCASLALQVTVACLPEVHA